MKITQKLEQINGARQRTGMSNNIYKKINYISWKEEAVKISLQNDEMVELLKNIKATRKKATTRTKRADFTEETFGFDQHGDYAELYMLENGQYVVYSTNVRDEAKNKTDNLKNIDIIFDKKFRDFTGTTLRRAFGFVDKTLKRCIPKQFYYVNKKYIGKTLFASSIDASSQYPSGCLGKLPDMHTAIRVSGRVAPSEEYPFAFYASGHLAIYNELDTHNWLAHKMFPYLFRLDAKDDWPFRPLKDDQEETILMKASSYTMDDTWNYFYNNKKNCKKDSEEYNVAKLIMNKTIGCWHRKDKEKKRMMDYDNHGSYQLAHIVAVAIARGNQKILNMIEQIGEMLSITRERVRQLEKAILIRLQISAEENEIPELAAAEKMAATIAKNAPIAVRNCKKAINDGLDMDMDQAIVLEEKLFGDCFETEDQKYGMAFFLDKNKEKVKEPFKNC